MSADFHKSGRRLGTGDGHGPTVAAMPTELPDATSPEPLTLIPPESLALVGQTESAPVTAEITALGAQRYAHAVGDLNPIYFDEAAAKAAGYRGLVAPPTFIQWALAPSRALSEINDDGLFAAKSGSQRLRLRVSRTLFGGEEWDFLEPVCVGDQITSTSRLAALEEKQGSKGPFVRITRETTFTNQVGDVVARARGIGIAR